MAIPVNQDTTAKYETFVEHDAPVDHIEIIAAAAINQLDFVVSAPWCGIADTDIALAATGTIYVAEGQQIQADSLVALEDTFATIGQIVYFKSATGEFSDTSTIGYYPVGYLVKAKDSNGVIVFEKTRYTVVVV